VNEALRLDYLQAMGVDSYVPRYVLDGAAESPLCDMGFPPADYDDGDAASADNYDIESEYQNLSAQRDSEKSAAGSSQARALQNSSPQSNGESRSRIASELEGINLDGKSAKRAVNVEEKDQLNAANDGAAQANPRFSVDLVGTDIGLLFVVDTTASALTPSEKRLLANIAVAVKTHHHIESAPRFSSTKFQWPVVKTPSFAQGANAAKDALLGNVMAHAERQNAPCIVVFGEQIQPYFDHDILASASLTVLFSASPAAMMSDGALKAALWQQLRGHAFPTQDSE
jgi:hypothetical protein